MGDAHEFGLVQDILGIGIGGWHQQAVLGIAEVQLKQMERGDLWGQGGFGQLEDVGSGLVVEAVVDGVGM